MKGTRFRLLALSALLSVGALAAVATHSVSAQTLGLGSVADRAQALAQQASTHMNVTLDEFDIMPDTQSVPAGELSVDVTNTGENLHELVLIKSDMDIKSLPMSTTNTGEVDEDAVGEVIGDWEDVQSGGGTASGTLVLAPGRYILLCNLKDHYKNGMVTTLQVN